MSVQKIILQLQNVQEHTFFIFSMYIGSHLAVRQLNILALTGKKKVCLLDGNRGISLCSKRDNLIHIKTLTNQIEATAMT